MSIGAPASPITAGSVAQLGLSLALIVGLIFAASWLLKRLRLGAAGNRGGMTVLAELALGPRDRILLVGVGDAQVLVGISAAGMVALNPLTQPVRLPAPAPAPGSAFADKLRDLVQRPGAPS
jgi:flagellar protein FliO/FliZ